MTHGIRFSTSAFPAGTCHQGWSMGSSFAWGLNLGFSCWQFGNFGFSPGIPTSSFLHWFVVSASETASEWFLSWSELVAERCLCTSCRLSVSSVVMHSFIGYFMWTCVLETVAQWRDCKQSRISLFIVITDIIRILKAVVLFQLDG